VVNFSGGCTTGWHTHNCDQLLIATSGSGMVATEHDQREITVGDVVHIKAGERHWHGAKADTTMGHITVTLRESAAVALSRIVATEVRTEFAPDLYGAFSVKRLFWVCCQFFVRSGKAVLRPVACGQVPGARGRGQGTETLAELGGLPPSVACVSQRLEAWARGGTMNREMGLFEALASDGAY
jgi:hypothetical protein